MKPIELKELKTLELDILKYVDEFCKRENITYFLCGGTLLGALRHKGFIPWDDDIDIMMPRPDYERFIRSFINQGHYKCITPYNTHSYMTPYAVVNDERTYRCAGRKNSQIIGVNIDVFPIDGLPEDPKETEKFFNRLKFKYEFMCSGILKLEKGQTFVSTIKRNVGILCFRLLQTLGLVSVNSLARKIDSFAQTFDYSTSKYVGITTISHYGSKEKNEKEKYFPVIDMVFEDSFFNAPSNYDTYLSRLYGDYMKMPPIEKQITHHSSEYFWK